jgi:hypothetical protein
MAIEFVGYTTGTLANGGSGYPISLTALTGGIGSSVLEGDLVVVFSGWSSGTNGDPGVVSPAATEVADLYVSGTNDANMSAAYFFAGASPPTSVVVYAFPSTANGSAGTALVFRGVDITTPLDATSTTATNNANNDPNPPAITPVTSGAWVVIGGLTALANNTGTHTAPAGYTLAGTASISGTGGGSARGVICSGAYKANVTPGVSEDPGSFVASAGGTSSTWAAVTMALRPARGFIKRWSGSAWVSEPVKYWNGSAWTTKPLKRWNGSTWVLTSS